MARFLSRSSKQFSFGVCRRSYCIAPGSHCSWCGNKFTSRDYPKVCNSCNNVTYSNPLPVVVGLIYKTEGSSTSVLCIRRGIEPKKGELALIGGFLESGETWQSGLSREIQEEVEISIDPNAWKLQDVYSVTKPPRLIISASAKYPKEIQDITKESFTNEEVQDVLWVNSSDPVELCFETHNSTLNSFWKER